MDKNCLAMLAQNIWKLEKLVQVLFIQSRQFIHPQNGCIFQILQLIYYTYKKYFLFIFKIHRNCLLDFIIGDKFLPPPIFIFWKKVNNPSQPSQVNAYFTFHSRLSCLVDDSSKTDFFNNNET